jgi:GNAT superfamily N-acetyltransferase
LGEVTNPPRSSRGLSSPRPLSPDHDTSCFDSGNEVLDRWLKTRALENERRYSRTFVVLEGEVVVAYYSLANAGERREALPSKLRRNAPETIPLVLLGRLAVARSHRGRGLGGALLRDAFRRTMIVAENAGCRGMIVHAIDDAAAKFYRDHDFVELPGAERALFIAIETIADAFAG